jgi:hypothetical protein
VEAEYTELCREIRLRESLRISLLLAPGLQLTEQASCASTGAMRTCAYVTVGEVRIDELFMDGPDVRRAVERCVQGEARDGQRPTVLSHRIPLGNQTRARTCHALYHANDPATRKLTVHEGP